VLVTDWYRWCVCRDEAVVAASCTSGSQLVVRYWEATGANCSSRHWDHDATDVTWWTTAAEDTLRRQRARSAGIHRLPLRLLRMITDSITLSTIKLRQQSTSFTVILYDQSISW